ncbi:MAG: phosphoribosylamine--glycine ligase [Bacteroidales bacterium]|nr:phosphoribosylamine--glycine ligase [Bacteroidales bacterium]MBN2748562.1 phosphoribosylamine--glycine ligase [Bacteroidales bacterium]
MNVLVLGSGGREHAICWKLAQSKNLNKLFVAPGNPGTAAVASNVNINPLDFAQVKSFIVANGIHMVVVGPEEPLVKGISNYLQADPATSNVMIIGPGQNGAQLEGSKDFAKSFMLRHGVPTAAYKTFSASEASEAKTFLTTMKPPYVLKADGLAAGKGVVISPSIDEAKETLDLFFAGKFGDASKKVVIEEFLSGIELSVFVLTDGQSYVILPEAKDYKRIGDGDTGLNTGGMGAVSPVPFASKEFMDKVETRIVRPTVEGLKKDSIDYRGFIFIGLIKVNNEPFVIEYNVRMGDPETEAVMPRIESDLLDLLEKAATGKLKGASIKTSTQTATTVILVSGGYPEEYKKNIAISGLDKVSETLVFHSGTKEHENCAIVTAGGRVLALTSLGNSISDALSKSYSAAETITYHGKYYRKDIGKDLMQ